MSPTAALLRFVCLAEPEKTEIEDILEELETFSDRLGSFVAGHAVGQSLVTWYRHRVAALRRAFDKQGEVMRAVRDVTQADDDSVGVALGSLMQLTQSQRGFIVLRGRDGALTFPAARTFSAMELDEPEVHISRSILREALGGKSTIAVADALADDRFSSTGSVQALALRAVLAVPISTHGRTWGAVYLDNPLRAGAFSAEACRSVERFAELIAPVLERDLALHEVDRERGERARRLRAEHDFADIIGDSDALVDALTALARIAPTDAVVLIEGETGTGKELFARKIHALSRRASHPFVTIDCGLPLDSEDRLFEAASGGTLFFDEVAELSSEAQAKLLRVLAAAPEVRVIAATNRELPAEVSAGRFRQELLYRLDVVRLRAPALREREGDVALLATHFLAKFAEEHVRALRGFRPEALSALEAFAWPGNVRELANTIERGVILSSDTETELALDPLGLVGSSDAAPDSTDMKSAIKAYKRRLVERALDTSKGSNVGAAKLLGVHPKYLYQLLRELEVVPPSAPRPTRQRRD